MGVMNLRDIPDDLQKALKIRAIEEGVTLRKLVIRYCEQGLAADKKKKRR